MKNTKSTGLLYDWFTFLPDYVCGMKQKLRTSRNKISMQIPVTGARCTIVWAIRDGIAPYWRTHHILMGHIKFYGAMARPKVISGAVQVSLAPALEP